MRGRRKPAPGASQRQAERKARNAIGLQDGDERYRVCTACSRVGDRLLGRWRAPDGAVCARCGKTRLEGVMVEATERRRSG